MNPFYKVCAYIAYTMTFDQMPLLKNVWNCVVFYNTDWLPISPPITETGYLSDYYEYIACNGCIIVKDPKEAWADMPTNISRLFKFVTPDGVPINPMTPEGYLSVLYDYTAENGHVVVRHHVPLSLPLAGQGDGYKTPWKQRTNAKEPPPLNKKGKKHNFGVVPPLLILPSENGL